MRKILKDAHFQNASCNLFVSVVLLGGVLISLKFNLDSFRFPSYILGMLIGICVGNFYYLIKIVKDYKHNFKQNDTDG